MSDNVINIPRESTMKALMEMQKMAVAGGANPGAADLCYKYMVAQCTSKEQVDNLFIEWWKSQYDARRSVSDAGMRGIYKRRRLHQRHAAYVWKTRYTDIWYRQKDNSES